MAKIPAPYERPKKEPEKLPFSVSEIETEAYYQWVNRGCPLGDDQTDWYKAIKALRERKMGKRS
jgi:hypothetical protein